MRVYPRWWARYLALAVTAWAAFFCSTLAQAQFHIVVETETAAPATKYYERIGKELGFDVTVSTLDGLLREAGYTLTAVTLEVETPQVLGSIPGVAATRFFAPKITDVSKQPPEARKIGWRKLVRLNTKPKQGGGGLAVIGIGSVFVLFNTFTDLSTGEAPFPDKVNDPNRSHNTQVMLVREGNAPGLQDAAYWIVYNEDGKPIEFLTGSFDARSSDSDSTHYFVPDACAQCHGGAGRVNQQGEQIFPAATLNPLDTDHWFDRMAPDDDFPALAAS